MNRSLFTREVEERIQTLTLNPFIHQNDLAIFLNTTPKVVRAELKERGVPLTRFGYSTQKVISALELQGYLNTLKEFRA